MRKHKRKKGKKEKEKEISITILHTQIHQRLKNVFYSNKSRSENDNEFARNVSHNSRAMNFSITYRFRKQQSETDLHTEKSRN